MADDLKPARPGMESMETPSGTRAIVRDVPSSFGRAIRPAGSSEPIDIQLARRQHRRYCEALESLGLTLVRLRADDRYPDCCFVEDTAVVVGDKAIVAAMAAPSRRGETAAVEAALSEIKAIRHVLPPATLDGGDVLRVGDRVFVGLSARTNEHAVEQLRAMLAPDGYEITPVHVSRTLHLKSACTYLGDNLLVYRPGHLDDEPFRSYRKITVSEGEAHAANCLSLNGHVLVPAGAPLTRARIEVAGLQTVELDISELRKAAGGLTCSSLIT
jgi:dimethylargininase